MATLNKPDDEIRIRRVSPQLINELNCIAGNLGISLSSLLKPRLREIRDSYAPDLWKESKKD